MSDQLWTTHREALEHWLLDEGAELTLLVDPEDERILAARGQSEPILGFSPEDLRGRALEVLVPSICPAGIRFDPSVVRQSGRHEELWVSDAAHDPVRVTLEVRRLGKELDPTSGNRPLVAVRLRSGGPAAVLQGRLATVHGELASAYQSLRTQQQALDEAKREGALALFAAALAHEMNNPTAVVFSNLSFIGEHLLEMQSPKDDAGLGAELLHVVGESKQAADRIALIASRLRVLEMPPEPRQAEVVTVLMQVTDGAEGSVSAPKDFLAHSDPQILHALTQELWQNAQHFGGQSGHPRLQLIPHAESFEIVVKDDGPGIAAEHRDHIFLPFFTTAPPGEGLGLGLFLARHHARSLGGELRLLPDVEQGAAFQIELPRTLLAPSSQHLGYEALRAL